MDSNSVRSEPDPVRSRRIVRPRLDRECLGGFHTLEFVIGIVAVVRIGIGRDDLEATRRGRLLIAPKSREPLEHCEV